MRRCAPRLSTLLRVCTAAFSELWCDIPYFVHLFVQLRVEDPGFDMTVSVPFFVVPLAWDPGREGTMSNMPKTKAWRQQQLDAFFMVCDLLMSARGVRGLDGFRQAATQTWLSYTGSVEMVMRMGVWKPKSTRFVFVILNYRCRGPLRSHTVDYYREDRQVMAKRFEELE